MNKANFFDIEKIRDDFPIFKNNPKFIYFDNASTTQKPNKVINAISDYYENYNANVHRGIYEISERSTQAYENVRDKVTDFIGAKDRRSIVFTKGATESINLVANSIGKTLNPLDEVLITEMEHHSNIIPWQLACNRHGARMCHISILNDGSLDLSNINDLITEKTKIVCLIHQSNVFGTINNIDKIIKIAHEKGALVLIDAAQSVPHDIVDVIEMGCDFLAFSGHKMLGPTGVGVLYAKPEILEGMEPFLGGGQMIREVSLESSSWNDIPWKFEAGTPNIAQVIGLGAAIDYINSIGMKNIIEHEQKLLKYAEEKLNNFSNINIYGNPSKKGSIISFNIKNIHPHDMAHLLDASGIAIRAGHHCAQPIMKYLNISSTNRISFYLYNTIQEIDQLIAGIKQAIKIFN